jgi:carboxylesterase
MIESGAAVRDRLGEIRCPALIITSRQDHVVTPTDSDMIAAAVSGPVERLWLEKSFHVATLDYDRAEVEAASVAFAQRVLGAR